MNILLLMHQFIPLLNSYLILSLLDELSSFCSLANMNTGGINMGQQICYENRVIIFEYVSYNKIVEKHSNII